MKLVLNNKRVNGYDLSVMVTKEIADDDLSGNGSSTATAENGVKPKTFFCGIKIRFDTPNYLKQIDQLSEAVDAGGLRITYDIANETAKAMNVRQVRFAETLSVRKIEGINAWDVSFTLKEYKSVAEKVESRQQDKPATGQTAQGTSIPPDGPNTSVEKTVMKIETFIGGYLFPNAKPTK
jgi:hypothetical protein